jgi:ABC-type multidrug transport system ATPase subunit
MGYCPQDDIIFLNYTVRDNVSLFGRNRGVTSSQINEHVSAILDLLDLRRVESRLASTLSGGNKRRLCVAMAIAGGPVLSVLDEPSTGLDPLARRRLWGVVKMLANSDTRSVLLTTHLMEEADALSNRVGIMLAGELKASGSPQELKNRLGAVFEVTMVVPRRSENELIDLAMSLQEQGSDENANLLEMALLTKEQGENMISIKYGEAYVNAFSKDFDNAETLHPTQIAEWILNAKSAETLKSWVSESFIGTRRLINEMSGILKWEVSNFGKVLDLFRVLEKAKTSGVLEQYTIAQPSLEQVFAKVTSEVPATAATQ